MRRSRRIAFVLLALLAVAAGVGPWLAPHSLGAVVAPDSFEGISRAFPLGSDYLGRDMLSRVLHAMRLTVGLALASALLASGAGALFALWSAASPRWLDECISRLFDTLISIPSKIFALVMVAAFGASIPLLLLTAGLTYMPGAFRMARSLAVNQYAMDYVQAARARGEGRWYIAVVEILPNMLQPLLADFGLRFMFVVLLLSGLSFLGLGVQPPYTDLGSLVRENVSGLAYGAPAVIAPAVVIAVLTIAVNLLIDSFSSDRGRSEFEH